MIYTSEGVPGLLHLMYYSHALRRAVLRGAVGEAVGGLLHWLCSLYLSSWRSRCLLAVPLIGLPECWLLFVAKQKEAKELKGTNEQKRYWSKLVGCRLECADTKQF